MLCFIFFYYNKMVYITINKYSPKLIKKLDDSLKHKKTFVLFYMDGCGPCEATRPEWNKLQNVLNSSFHRRNDVSIVDIDQNYTRHLKHMKNDLRGFPTMRCYENNQYENYEDSSISNKDRTIDSFVEWINLKLNDKHEKNATKHKINVNHPFDADFRRKTLKHKKHGRKTRNHRRKTSNHRRKTIKY